MFVLSLFEIEVNCKSYVQATGSGTAEESEESGDISPGNSDGESDYVAGSKKKARVGVRNSMARGRGRVGKKTNSII